MSGPGDDTGGDQSGAGSDDATRRLPSQPGAAGDATQRLPSQPATGGDATQRLPSQPGPSASSSPIDPDADLKHSKLVGYMSVPVHRLLPIRRSTLLMIVAFIGFGILLHVYPPQSAPVVYTAPNGEQYNLTPVPVTTTTSTTTTQPTTTSTTGPTATTRPVTTTTSAGRATTTTSGQSPGSSTTVPASTTTTQVGSSGSTTTTQVGTSKTGTTTTTAP